ncbi:MAG: hypothetical protein ABJL99_08835 [Aliishimia sp.]
MTASEKIAMLRSVLLGLTGLVCVSYAVLAIVQGRPDPMPWFVPGVLGILSGIIISASFARAGPKAIRAATDELHREVNSKAQRHAYWVSLALFVVVSVLSGTAAFDRDTGFAVLGTLMGSSYLLLFVLHEWRMR